MAERLEIVDVQADTLATMGLLPDQHPDSALQALTKAVEIAESAELLSHAARAHTNLAALLANRIQDFQTARDHYRRSAELKRLKGSKAGELMGMGGVAEVSLLLGDLDATEATFPTLRQLLAEVTDPGPAVFHFRKIEALLLRYRGDLEAAAQRLRVLQTEERQRGNLQNQIEVNSQLAEILLESYTLQSGTEFRPLDETETLLEEARVINEGGIGNKEWLCYLMSMMRTHQGRLEDAQYFLDEAREVNNLQSTLINRGWLSFAEAKLRVVEENWKEALAAFDSTLNIFTELQMRWWKARVLQDWAEMYATRGMPADYEQAIALLREALASFGAMGASFYAELVKDKLQALEAKSYSQALVHKKVAQEMAWAGEIQSDFLPKKPPQIPGWQVAVTLRPARETSGDFYDFIHLPGGRWGIVIADVTDKGLGAALYMTLSHTLIRTFAGEYPNQPEQLLTAVNRRILADTPANLFVTAIYGILDPATGTFVYCNAGQNPPYLFSAGNAIPIGILKATGIPLGIFEDKSWEQGAIVIEPENTLVLYSDGITEAQNPAGAFFGEKRLLQVVGDNLGRSAQETLEAIILALREFVGKAPQSDDITLVVITRES
jgi:serine phosphatase RsbU (regulator of sigma subunit)